MPAAARELRRACLSAGVVLVAGACDDRVVVCDTPDPVYTCGEDLNPSAPDDPGPPAQGLTIGFAATPIRWAFPPEIHGGTGDDALWKYTWGGGYELCVPTGCGAQGRLRFELLDVTGDRRPDLVLTERQCVDSDIGVTWWAVYPNTGTGFASAAVPFRLPHRRSALPAGVVAADSSCEVRSVDRGSADLDGDGRVDRLLLEDHCLDPRVGEAFWIHYANDGSCFSADGTRWPLPPVPEVEGVAWPGAPWGWYEDSVCADGTVTSRPAYSTRDFTGDGLPDLALYHNDCVDDELGASRWDVYPNLGAGFAPEPVAWPLPYGPWHTTHPEAGDQFQYSASCPEGSPKPRGAGDRLIEDLTGDGIPDFVVTLDECEAPPVGAHDWRVYPGTPGGFETDPLPWPLPPSSRGDAGWVSAWGGRWPGPCVDGSEPDEDCYSVALRDQTGDGLPDLVLECDACGPPGLGRQWWAVYPNSGVGFAPEPVRWALPSQDSLMHDLPLTSKQYDEVLVRRCADGRELEHEALGFDLLDLTGDGIVDLVVTTDPCEPEHVGSQTWRVYPGVVPR